MLTNSRNNNNIKNVLDKTIYKKILWEDPYKRADWSVMQ